MVQLDGQRVRLREFRHDDLDTSLRIVGDDRVTRWLSFDSLTREQQAVRLTGAIERAVANPRSEWYLAVTPRTAGDLIGFVRIGLSGVKAAKLGYAIAPGHWGHGFATDSARTMITFAFHVLGLSVKCRRSAVIDVLVVGS